MTLTGKVTRRGQITIPQEIRDKLNMEEGSVVLFELIEGRIHVIPTAIIPADQAWFWTKEHQAKEYEAEEDLQKGRYKTFTSTDDLIKDLRHGSGNKKTK